MRYSNFAGRDIAMMKFRRQIKTGPSDSQVGRQSHYETLDLLRGVVAISVVLYHFSSRVNYAGLMYHGYLAVDFFFCLSGYVIFHAYFNRIRSNVMTVSEFIAARLIRFMPLVLLGNAIAAFTDIFRPGQHNFVEHAWDISEVLFTNTLLIPTLHQTTLESTTYPLNGPVWSLFFELIANIIFVLIAKSTHAKHIMMVLCAISLLLLVKMSLVTGNIHFGPHIEFFMYAFPRVFFSFFAGALLNYVTKTSFSMSWSVSSIVLLAIFSIQKIDNPTIGAAFDIVAISLVFPLIVYAGANHLGSPDKRLATIAGNASYPLYCIHYPIVRALSVVMRHYYLPDGLNIFISIVFTAMLFVLSILTFDVYDRPVRRTLTSYFMNLRRKITM